MLFTFLIFLNQKSQRAEVFDSQARAKESLLLACRGQYTSQILPQEPHLDWSGGSPSTRETTPRRAGAMRRPGGCKLCKQEGDRRKSNSREGTESGAGKEERGGLGNPLL